MTLYTTDYLEFFLTLVGWLINNGIWGTLAATGLFAVPFFAIVLQEWLRARGEGADEGNKGILSAARIETRVYVAIFVLIFAAVPLVNINLSTIQFDQSRSEQCQVSVPAPSETSWGTSFTELGSQSAKVPVWWFLIHSVSKGVTSAAVAAIPCGFDLRQMRMDVDNTRLDDPVLAQEVADFTRDCYGNSRAKLFQSRPTLTPEQQLDVNWIGSRYFLDSSDYYGSFNSSRPRAAWPYDETRDAGLAQVPSGGGYPICSDWWNASEIGLRSRILSKVEPGLLGRFAEWATFITQEQLDDSIIREVVAPRQQRMTQGRVYADYGGQVGSNIPNTASRLTGDIGLTASALAYFPAMDKVRQALPMVMSLLKMALVICIPLVIVLGTYDLKTLATITMVQFAFFFVDFWFQLARWLDSTIINVLYGSGAPHQNFNPVMGLGNGFSDMLLNFVMGTMFIVLPLLWTTALGWAGFKTGAALQGLTAGTSDAKSGGGAMGNKAMSKL